MFGYDIAAMTHETGSCPSGDKTCNGIVTVQVDPYEESIHGEVIQRPFCDGQFDARAREI